MVFWNILFFFAAVLFVGSIVLLLLFRFTKNRYFNSPIEDELLQMRIDGGAKNYIYVTSGETRKYIKKYVIRKSHFDKSVVCNYNENYSSISFFVKVFDKNKNVVQVIKCEEENVSNSSRIIIVDSRCETVNIVICAVDDYMLNESVICPIPSKYIKLYSLIMSALIFSAIFVLDYLFVRIIGGEYAKLCMKSLYNLLLLGTGAIVTVVYGLSVQRKLTKKNYRAKSGGYLDYEFF